MKRRTVRSILFSIILTVLFLAIIIGNLFLGLIRTPWGVYATPAQEIIVADQQDLYVFSFWNIVYGQVPNYTRLFTEKDPDLTMSTDERMLWPSYTHTADVTQLVSTLKYEVDTSIANNRRTDELLVTIRHKDLPPDSLYGIYLLQSELLAQVQLQEQGITIKTPFCSYTIISNGTFERVDDTYKLLLFNIPRDDLSFTLSKSCQTN